MGIELEQIDRVFATFPGGFGLLLELPERLRNTKIVL